MIFNPGGGDKGGMEPPTLRIDLPSVAFAFQVKGNMNTNPSG